MANVGENYNNTKDPSKELNNAWSGMNAPENNAKKPESEKSSEQIQAEIEKVGLTDLRRAAAEVNGGKAVNYSEIEGWDDAKKLAILDLIAKGKGAEAAKSKENKEDNESEKLNKQIKHNLSKTVFKAAREIGMPVSNALDVMKWSDDDKRRLLDAINGAAASPDTTSAPDTKVPDTTSAPDAKTPDTTSTPDTTKKPDAVVAPAAATVAPDAVKKPDVTPAAKATPDAAKKPDAVADPDAAYAAHEAAVKKRVDAAMAPIMAAYPAAGGGEGGKPGGSGDAGKASGSGEGEPSGEKVEKEEDKEKKKAGRLRKLALKGILALSLLGGIAGFALGGNKKAGPEPGPSISTENPEDNPEEKEKERHYEDNYDYYNRMEKKNTDYSWMNSGEAMSDLVNSGEVAVVENGDGTYRFADKDAAYRALLGGPAVANIEQIGTIIGGGRGSADLFTDRLSEGTIAAGEQYAQGLSEEQTLDFIDEWQGILAQSTFEEVTLNGDYENSYIYDNTGDEHIENRQDAKACYSVTDETGLKALKVHLPNGKEMLFKVNLDDAVITKTQLQDGSSIFEVKLYDANGNEYYYCTQFMIETGTDINKDTPTPDPKPDPEKENPPEDDDDKNAKAIIDRAGPDVDQRQLDEKETPKTENPKTDDTDGDGVNDLDEYKPEAKNDGSTGGESEKTETAQGDTREEFVENAGQEDAGDVNVVNPEQRAEEQKQEEERQEKADEATKQADAEREAIDNGETSNSSMADLGF